MASVARYCCCGGSCVYPSTSDTITFSIRNSASCAGCYDNNSGESVKDISVDVDGDYTLSWETDFGGERYFSLYDAAVTTGQMRVHGFTTDCTGSSALVSGMVLDITAIFDPSTGCLREVWTDLDVAGDRGQYHVFNLYQTPFAGSPGYAPDTWHATEVSCGGNRPGVAVDNIAIATSEAKWVID